MRKSIFLKTALIILPIILLLDAVVLVFTYKITYDTNLTACAQSLRNEAKNVLGLVEYFNPDVMTEERYSDSLSEMCEDMDFTYLFVIQPDVDMRSEKYLAIGFGEGASEDAKKTRYAGVVVNGSLSDAELEALGGTPEGVIVHENNRFDDTLICYFPLTRHFDFDSDSYVDNDPKLLLGAEMNISSVMSSFQSRYNIIVLVTVGLSLMMLIIIAFVMYHKLSKPIRKISKRMTDFVSDRDKEFEELAVKGKDEFAEMSRSFNQMAREIDDYIAELSKLNKEKHTQEAELNIAKSIQRGLLPPPEYEKENIRIKAYMKSAKDVGGDLYDYQELADGRMCIAIADVSGKGVTAALFMSRAITLLHQYAEIGYSPGKILGEFNRHLTENNPNGMFITAFVAIYDPETAELIYANAGHNIPYLVSDGLIPLDGAHGLAAGIFDDEVYTEASIPLKPNDTVFLYTDGVNEAVNVQNRFFGTDTLENLLKQQCGISHDDTLNTVLSALETFTKGAPQSDDITVLTLHLNQKAIRREITVGAKVENFDAIKKLLLSSAAFPQALQKKVYLACEEIFVNICSYAYEDGGGEVKVATELSDMLTVTFEDGGKPFDPTDNVTDINDYDYENSIGGLGRYIALEIADSYSYAYSNSKNILTIAFRLQEE